MISCNQCQVGADFGGVLGHSNCHHVSERSMKLRLKGRGIVKASNIEVKTPTYVTPCRMFCTLQYINTIMITCHDWKHLSKAFLISKAFSSLLCLQNHISENCGLSVAYLFKKIELGFRKPGFEGFANPTPSPCPLSSRPISFPCLESSRIPENCDWSRWQGDKGSICKAMQSFWALNFLSIWQKTWIFVSKSRVAGYWISVSHHSSQRCLRCSCSVFLSFFFSLLGQAQSNSWWTRDLGWSKSCSTLFFMDCLVPIQEAWVTSWRKNRPR